MSASVGLYVQPGTDSDQSELAQFSCWGGSPDDPWAEEAENYIRGWVLARSENVLLFRTEEAGLAAVTGYSQRWVDLPKVEPRRQAAWHLDILGVATDLQGVGIGTVVIKRTFSDMQQRDPNRALVTANVHKDNVPSIRAAEKAGLTPLAPIDDAYWTLLGELP